MPEGSKKSRLTQLKESDGESVFLQFPELDEAAYIVPLLHEAGLMSTNGMGAIPLSWQEIESWLRTTELELTVWEKLTIREMSDAYVAQLHQSTGKHDPAPYVPALEPEEIDRKAVASKVANVFRGFKRKPPGAD